MGERDADWERAHLRVEKIEWMRETPTGKSALDRARGVEEGDVDWERAHLRVEGNWG